MSPTTRPNHSARRLSPRTAFALALGGCGLLALPAAGSAVAGGGPPDPTPAAHHLPSTTENLTWGGFPIDGPPALTIGSGETVRIDTLSGSGATNPDVHPIEYFAQFGVSPDQILPDLLDFWKSVPDRERYGPHVVTGPVYVEGAEPGDVLEIEILDLDPRVPYGINSTGPTSGVMATTYPGFRDGDQPLDIPDEIPADAPAGVLPDVRQHLYWTGEHQGREVAFFDDDVLVPFEPFMGVMAVAPATGSYVGGTEDEVPPESGVQGSRPPGPFGGNLDVKDLTEGATLYLPVFQDGAQVFMGDPHGAQGDGEVSGTAIEQALSGTFRFTVHKDVALDGPWAEDADNWIMMGIDWDLDRAMRFAVEDTVEFLVREKGMTTAKAYSFASIAVDYHAAEVVDGTQVVTGKIPKAIFDAPLLVE